MSEIVRIEKLVHGGQGIGTLANGQRVFVWNALPGELVEIEISKKRSKLSQAIATKILEPSKDRVEARDDAYLSTSPWQILNFEAENTHKQAILTETIEREHVAFNSEIDFISGESAWEYRNKMEYSFWADDYGLHLALFNRGSHQKQIITGSSIALPAIDVTANRIVSVLQAQGVRGSQLKTVVVRCDQRGNTVAALFVKDESFPELAELSEVCQGIAVYYSTPKSPASVITKKLYEYGDITLHDDILNSTLQYDVNSFFQVNVPVFNAVANSIKAEIGSIKSVDMYAGVGTIGIPVGADVLVELDEHNIKMAEQNAINTAVSVVHSSSEKATQHISNEAVLIVDPPRAGLHADMINAIVSTMPPKVIYLSCNPATQARDLALLQSEYTTNSIVGYNFFPRTPHIESLAVLVKK